MLKSISKYIPKKMGETHSKEKKAPADSNDDSKNPMNELQILEGHTDIVRILLKIDELRIASAGDDGNILFWHRVTGQNTNILRGHTLPITTLLLVERNRIVSGSADRTIRIWDTKEGTCLHILRGHEGSVKCIASLGFGKFVSGGNDRKLIIWSTNGELLNTIERQEEENLHCLLPITGNKLITSSNSSLLLVYKTDTCTYHKVLSSHRESVRCLVHASTNLFASASLDGAIIIWQADTLIPLRILNNPEKYRNENRTYIFNVKFLLPLTEKYLAATIGNGYRIYDVTNGDCVLDCKNAHDGEVNSLVALYDGARIVSCSSDSTIKLWGTLQKVSFKKRDKPEAKSSGPFKKSTKVDPVPIGEMFAHTDAVNQLLVITENCFASCGSDNTVILWKDGRAESDIRSKFAAAIMMQHYQDMLLDEEESSNSSAGGSGSQKYKRTTLPTVSRPRLPIPFILEQTFSVETNSEQATEPVHATENAPDSAVLSSTPPKSVRIPEYIFDYAERLRKEEKMSLDKISEVLRQRGHSDSIVTAVFQKQSADFMEVAEQTVFINDDYVKNG